MGKWKPPDLECPKCGTKNGFYEQLCSRCRVNLHEVLNCKTCRYECELKNIKGRCLRYEQKGRDLV